MQLRIPKQIIQFLSSLLAAVILLVGVLMGVGEGKKLAQSAVLAGNSAAVVKGLHYFYQDQGRFPTAMEFLDNRNLMLNYFTVFPMKVIPVAGCSENFAYQRPTQQTFKLGFCLPVPWSAFHAGWNQFTEKD